MIVIIIITLYLYDKATKYIFIFDLVPADLASKIKLCILTNITYNVSLTYRKFFLLLSMFYFQEVG